MCEADSLVLRSRPSAQFSLLFFILIGKVSQHLHPDSLSLTEEAKIEAENLLHTKLMTSATELLTFLTIHIFQDDSLVH